MNSPLNERVNSHPSSLVRKYADNGQPSLIPAQAKELLNLRRLPAMLTVAQTAVLLNRGEHDIPILTRAGDSQGRRYSKIVSNWNGSAWTRALHEAYFYDAWNLLGVLNGTNNTMVKAFLWGLDMSGSLHGAGGVSGLIAFASRQAPVGTHFVAYDGNGNVAALVDGSGGSLTARYEYDPFGQTIRSSGSAAALNPLRFSSKHADDETDLAYYGYRYLSPNMGRWLSRDPIGERGGRNLYGFVANNSISRVDPLGLAVRCGVDSFLVSWNAGSELILGPGGTHGNMLILFVEIWFTTGPGFDPRCCEYKQNVLSVWSVVHTDGTWEHDNTAPLHDDRYSRGDDTDGNPALEDPHFTTNDNPGIYGVQAGDNVAYMFTAEQIVYTPQGRQGYDTFTGKYCLCSPNSLVAKRGPHTAFVTGVYPNLSWSGVGVDLQ